MPQMDCIPKLDKTALKIMFRTLRLRAPALFWFVFVTSSFSNMI